RWDTDPDFGTAVVRTSDIDAGFENLDTPADTSPFNEGETIRYTIQSADALTEGETYYYQIRGNFSDPYGEWSERRSITVDTAVTHSTWHQTTDAQWNENSLTDVRTTGSNNVIPYKPYIKVQRLDVVM